MVAPGRVNLIGEHIDYNGLPVLPMALDRAVRIDFATLDEPVVRLTSAAPGCEPTEFRLDRPVVRALQGDWSNYVRAAAWGLVENKGPLEACDRSLRGIEGQVDSDLPVASGLASSSALVVAGALALLKANDVEVAPLDLAALTARAEQFTGVRGGGMDQAACLCGVAGHALRIDFDPLRTTPVPMPDDWRWIVASSLAPAEKSRGAMAAYNARTRECSEALAQVVAALPSGGAPSRSYRALTGAFPVDELLDRAARAVGPRLLPRFRHVVTERRRVEEAQRAMAEARIDEFGALMVQSHRSLRDDYEVSTPALDEIVSIALDAGAAGARLTGAGFGGCAIVLCSRRAAPTVAEALTARFYAKRRERRLLDDPPFGAVPPSEPIFEARPSAGARVAAYPLL